MVALGTKQAILQTIQDKRAALAKEFESEPVWSNARKNLEKIFEGIDTAYNVVDQTEFGVVLNHPDLDALCGDLRVLIKDYLDKNAHTMRDYGDGLRVLDRALYARIGKADVDLTIRRDREAAQTAQKETPVAKTDTLFIVEAEYSYGDLKWHVIQTKTPPLTDILYSTEDEEQADAFLAALKRFAKEA